MSALPTKADMRLVVQKCPLSATSRHCYVSYLPGRTKSPGVGRREDGRGRGLEVRIAA